jgi:hypothetical protein
MKQNKDYKALKQQYSITKHRYRKQIESAVIIAYVWICLFVTLIIGLILGKAIN